MMSYKTISDFDFTDKTVIIRVDWNVPQTPDGRIADPSRIDATLPTLLALSKVAKKIRIITHYGRPKGWDPMESIEFMIPYFKKKLKELGQEMPNIDFFKGDWKDEKGLQDLLNLKAKIVVLENIRFYPGEEKNDPAFVHRMTMLGDVFIHDAFSCAHRAHASTEGIARALPSCAGLLMDREIKMLTHILETPKRPSMAIIGGAKISTKINVLKNLLDKVDILAIGGAMANTFLLAQGHPVGKSLVEPNHLQTATDLMRAAAQNKKILLLPVDVVVARNLESNTASRIARLSDIQQDEAIYDIGPLSVDLLFENIKKCKSLLWNGPVGVFEIPPFDQASLSIAKIVGTQSQNNELLSIAGGGDTVALLNHAGVTHQISYASLAGGAFLEWIEGRSLPGVLALSQR